jgi:hypothetical protein
MTLPELSGHPLGRNRAHSENSVRIMNILPDYNKKEFDGPAMVEFPSGFDIG